MDPCRGVPPLICRWVTIRSLWAGPGLIWKPVVRVSECAYMCVWFENKANRKISMWTENAGGGYGAREERGSHHQGLFSS